MKKTFAIVIALALVLTCFASTAFAVMNSFQYATIKCQPNMEVGLDTDRNTGKLKNPGVFYVRHYLHGDFGGVYNNYFKAGNTLRNATKFCGGDWMAPDTANFIRSSSLSLGSVWQAYGRGNTDYGLSTIVISGYSDFNEK